MREIIDMCGKIKDRRLSFILNPDDSWYKFDPALRDITNGGWNEVKFMEGSSSDLHNSMSTIPNDSGGIYAFILKPEIIPSTHLYILYIGRAKYSTSQNLRKRCSEYIRDERPKILSMVTSWGKDLYIRYLPLRDNNIIERLENELIRAILPPCNDKYPDKITNQAVKAAFM